MLGMLGEVVGKVWEFCIKGVFRGFQVGGGIVYMVNGMMIFEIIGKLWVNQYDEFIFVSEENMID